MFGRSVGVTIKRLRSVGYHDCLGERGATNSRTQDSTFTSGECVESESGEEMRTHTFLSSCKLERRSSMPPDPDKGSKMSEFCNSPMSQTDLCLALCKC